MELRASGLTWRAIAALLTRAGARRRDGRPISSDQIRGDATRLIRRRDARASSAPAVRSAVEPALKTERSGASSKQTRKTQSRSLRQEGVERPPAVNPRTILSKDVSSDDVAAALARIQK